MTDRKFFSRDILLIAFSAFFADLGYQGVNALFPLFIVLDLHEPVYVYGIITGASFGIGSIFAFLGGRAGDRHDRKAVAILGNLFIPLMSFSGLSGNVWLCAPLFILGWWARFFRTPARRALLVEASPRDLRSKAFGFLHALDVGGGILSALLALFLVMFLHLPVGTVILMTAAPLVVSTLLLVFIKREKIYPVGDPPSDKPDPGKRTEKADASLFTALLMAATFYGFSFYNAGFPVLTAAMSRKSGYALGLAAYAVYLSVSAASGYIFGDIFSSRGGRPIRALWSLGYLPSAAASLLIGASVFFGLPRLAFYGFIAMLGLGMGATETFEPSAASSLVRQEWLSRGMGWLSATRGLGQFASNIVMGILFTMSQPVSYCYAFVSSLAAALILAWADFTTDARKR